MKKKTSILLSIGILLFLIIVLGYFLIIKNQQSMRSKYEMERSARIIMSIDLINVSSKLFYYDNKTYLGFENSPDVQQAKARIIQNRGSDFIINISPDGESYCSSVFIPGRNSFYCIDNNSEISGKFSTSTPLCSTNYFSCEEELKDETAELQTPESQEEKEIVLDTNCDLFPTKLDSCTKYKCQFIHPLTGETMIKEILGIIDGKCNYIEEMPNNGKLECKYTESMRKAAAQYYKDIASAESVGTEVSGELGGEIEIKYTIDGKEVENPLQEALTIGQCVISGY